MSQFEVTSINGRQFRKALISPPRSFYKKIYTSNQYDEDFLHLYEKETDDVVFDSNQMEFVQILSVPDVFCSAIIGPKGATVKRLEKDTETRIKIFYQPTKKETSATRPIEIRSKKKEAVLRALTEVKLIIKKAEDHHPYTHFLCVPFLKLQLDNLFKDLKECGIDPDLFVPLQRIHLTLVMLKLFDDKKIETLKSILNETKKKFHNFFDQRFLSLTIQNLDIMNDDPTECKVLYMSVQETESLEKLGLIIKYIVQNLLQKNLITMESLHNQKNINDKGDFNIKYHISIVRASLKKKHHKHIKSDVIFDASEVLKKYGSISLGQHPIESINLVRYGGNYDDDGFYQRVFCLPLS